MLGICLMIDLLLASTILQDPRSPRIVFELLLVACTVPAIALSVWILKEAASIRMNKEGLALSYPRAPTLFGPRNHFLAFKEMHSIHLNETMDPELKDFFDPNAIVFLTRWGQIIAIQWDDVPDLSALIKRASERGVRVFRDKSFLKERDEVLGGPWSGRAPTRTRKPRRKEGEST